MARAWQEPIKESADAPRVALGGRVQEVLQLGKDRAMAGKTTRQIAAILNERRIPMAIAVGDAAEGAAWPALTPGG